MFYLREPFSFPADLAAPLENALAPALRKAGPALRSLWPKLAKGRGQAVEGEKHYSFRREEAEAYAAYYLPVNCLKPALALEEAFLTGTDAAPGAVDWLDFGTGPGTAFWGAAWWCARRNKKLHFTGWDQSPHFTQLARDLVARAPFGARAEFTNDGDPLSLIRRLKPTHVSFMNSLAEIYPSEDRRLAEVSKILAALKELERKDARPRFLLLIEPGSRDSSRELAALKDRLQAEQLGQVFLPCLDDRPCGALADPRDWCHEEAACEFPGWLNELGAAAGLRKEALIFSYAWIRAGKAERPFLGGQRIVSQRMERKGQVECRICTQTGKQAVRVQRSKASAENEFLLQACRGDVWRKAEIGPKGDIERAEPGPAGLSPLFGNQNS